MSHIYYACAVGCFYRGGVYSHAQPTNPAMSASSPSPLQGPPDLAELSRALDTLSKEEVRYLCTLLGVRPSILSNIDASHPNDSLTCITKYLEAWLASDGPLSWDVVLDQLTSRRLEKTGLAAEIKKKYCPSANDSSEILSLVVSQESSEFESLSTSSEEDIPDSGDTDVLTPYPTPSPPLPCQSLDPLPVSPPPSNNLTHSDQLLIQKVTRHKSRFRAIVVSANAHLSQRMSKADFERFKTDLITLPMMGNTHHFLQRKKKKILKAKSVAEVFEILDHYWNHIDYALLEHIVMHYCDGTIKKQMKSYKHKLHKFEKTTSVKQLVSARATRNQVPLDYSALTATLENDGKDCSLYQIREVKSSFTERANLEPYVALLQDLHTSSVVLTIAFPYEINEYLRQSLDPALLLEVGIKPDSLRFLPPPMKEVRINQMANYAFPVKLSL